MGDPVHKAALFEEFARVGKALGNGKRLELLDLLTQGERSVEALAATAGLGLSTASAHLQTLRHAGLVTTRRAGTRVYYGIVDGDVLALYALLREVAQTNLPDVEAKRIAYLDLHGSRAAEEKVSREELLTRAAAGTVTVLDVRPGEEYGAGHIPGAISIPLDQLEDRLAEVPQGRDVVAYCRGAYCVLAYEALDRLRQAGHTAHRLNEGMLEWRLAGLPVDSGAAA